MDNWKYASIFFLKAFERSGIKAFKICLFRTSPAEKDPGPDLSARAWFLRIRNYAGNPGWGRGGVPLETWLPAGGRRQASTGPSRSPVACSVQESQS